jgi:hypothetical protein
MTNPGRVGRPSLLDESALAALERIAQANPSATWEEIGRLLALETE